MKNIENIDTKLVFHRNLRQSRREPKIFYWRSCVIVQPSLQKGHYLKLEQDWDGYYMIIKSLNDIVYRTQKPGGQFKVIQHLDWLATWNGDHNFD